jgi:hypothetical protein
MPASSEFATVVCVTKLYECLSRLQERLSFFDTAFISPTPQQFVRNRGDYVSLIGRGVCVILEVVMLRCRR